MTSLPDAPRRRKSTSEPMTLEDERPGDIAVIRALTRAAFEGAPYSDQTEAQIVDALRAAGALTLSLVAALDGEIVGHAAFSPVRIDGRLYGWYGLGPVSVRPDHQRRGIGSAVISHGLDRLRRMQARGCVVFGDPRYYGRFGFVCDPRLTYPPSPDGYFQRLSFTPSTPTGQVDYHAAFDAA